MMFKFSGSAINAKDEDFSVLDRIFCFKYG